MLNPNILLSGEYENLVNNIKLKTKVILKYDCKSQIKLIHFEFGTCVNS